MNKTNNIGRVLTMFSKHNIRRFGLCFLNYLSIQPLSLDGYSLTPHMGMILVAWMPVVWQAWADSRGSVAMCGADGTQCGPRSRDVGLVTGTLRPGPTHGPRLTSRLCHWRRSLPFVNYHCWLLRTWSFISPICHFLDCKRISVSRNFFPVNNCRISKGCLINYVISLKENTMRENFNMLDKNLKCSEIRAEKSKLGTCI